MGIIQKRRSVAQPGSASGLGPEGREFESLHSDHFHRGLCSGVRLRAEGNMGTGLKARIYKPSKTATQSGRNATVSRGNGWVLEFPRQTAAQPDRLMGWQSSSDTARQVKMRFPDKQTAITYAEEHHIAYQVVEPKSRRVKPRAYADNFSYTRSGSWTH